MPMFSVAGKPRFGDMVSTVIWPAAASLPSSTATRGSGEASSTTSTFAQGGRSGSTDCRQARVNSISSWTGSQPLPVASLSRPRQDRRSRVPVPIRNSALDESRWFHFRVRQTGPQQSLMPLGRYVAQRTGPEGCRSDRGRRSRIYERVRQSAATDRRECETRGPGPMPTLCNIDRVAGDYYEAAFLVMRNNR
jgi:hypothetical protein